MAIPRTEMPGFIPMRQPIDVTKALHVVVSPRPQTCMHICTAAVTKEMQECRLTLRHTAPQCTTHPQSVPGETERGWLLRRANRSPPSEQRHEQPHLPLPIPCPTCCSQVDCTKETGGDTTTGSTSDRTRIQSHASVAGEWGRASPNRACALRRSNGSGTDILCNGLLRRHC